MPALPFEMTVELGKVREFADAVRADGPGLDFTDPDPISPPTFLASAAFWKQPKNEVANHAAEFARTLHAAEVFDFPAGPPRAGSRLIGRSHIGAVTRKRGRRGGNMTFTEVITVYTDGDGVEVARTSSTTVVVERPPTTDHFNESTGET
jgi:hypothetical protein